MNLWVDKLEEALEVENTIWRSSYGKVQEENTVKENNEWMTTNFVGWLTASEAEGEEAVKEII